jgi:hypothetical protein
MIYKTKQAKVEMLNGIPTLTVDSRPIGPMSFQWGLSEQSESQLKALGQAGVRLYFLRIALSNPDKLDGFMDSLRDHVYLLRKCVPDALAIIWFVFQPYEEFGEKYPDEVIVFNDGCKGGWTNPDFMHVKDSEVPRFSFASEIWKSEICGMLRTIVRQVNESDLAETIIGYFFFSLCYEWSWFWDYDSTTRCMDYSPAMCAAFRNFLIDKYAGNVAALRMAWNDDTVTFNTIKVPGFDRRQHTDCGVFWDPAKSAQIIDYAQCHAQVVTDKLAAFSRVCKEESAGRAVVGSFWGYLQNQNFLWGGQARFKELMDWPYLDFWAAPYTYENKAPGDFASMRYMVKSLQQHGKLYFAEADTFIWDTDKNSLLHHGFPETTFEQSRELLKRDYVYPLCEGTQAWWIDWSSGPSQYSEDCFLPLMKRMQQISEAACSMPMGGVSDIAAIVDQESLVMCTDKKMVSNLANKEATDVVYTIDQVVRRFPSHLMYNAIDRFRVHELPRIGTPVDFYETDDVLDDGFRKHKMFIFLNNYAADNRERLRILERLKKDGNVLVFMYASGFINPNSTCTIGPDNVSELTSIRMGLEMIDQRAYMRLTEHAPEELPGLVAGKCIGDFERTITAGFDFASNSRVPFPPAPNRIDPVLYVQDPEAVPLGEYIEGGKIGFALKKFTDWTSVYIGSPSVQAYVLRAIAKLAGAHLFVDNGDVIVYANESFVALHTERDDYYEIRLKQSADVCEAFDKQGVAKQTLCFTEHIPAETTRLYCLRPDLLK